MACILKRPGGRRRDEAGAAGLEGVTYGLLVTDGGRLKLYATFPWFAWFSRKSRMPLRRP